jgi:hypothetical protein
MSALKLALKPNLKPAYVIRRWLAEALEDPAPLVLDL